MKRENFEGLPAFLEVAQRKSFTEAAARLAVSPSAVSHAVRQLENRIGVPLFHRTTRSVELTEVGRHLYEAALPAAEAIRDALDTARGLAGRPTGTLRLNVPGVALPLVVNPLLIRFQEVFPDIKVEIAVDDAFGDIVALGHDAGIRLGETVARDMVAVRMTPQLAWVVVGSPDYFARHGRPGRIEDLTEHACIGYRQSATGGIYPWKFVQDGQLVEVAIDGPLVTNDTSVMVRAALDGVGLVYYLDAVTQQYEQDCRLERVLDGQLPDEAGLFLYFPQRSRQLPALRAFIDVAKKRLA